MKRPRPRGFAPLVAAALLLPLLPLPGASASPGNAPAANFEGDTVPAPSDAGPAFHNGQDATVDEFPAIIAGVREGGSRPQGQSCTGSVVAPRKILIAAHCADASGEKSFVYGLDDLNAGGGFRTAVVEYKKHPKYVNFDQGYDVAVVTVADDIPVRGGRYAQFATSADSGLATPGKSGLGFGYGKKDFNDNQRDVTLDKATLPIVNGDSLCQGVGAGFKSATMICAGYSDGRTTILPGDSGGPLIVDGKIVGVASWSRSDFKWYSVYGRLTNDMGDWVRQEVGTPQSDFALGTSPGSLKVTAGRHASATVTSVAGSGGPESVSLSASGLPSGAKAVFQPTSIQSGSNAKLTVETTAATPNGTYDVTVTGAGAGGKTATAKLSLTVEGGDQQPGDFTLGLSPSSLKVAAGEHGSTTVTSVAGSGGPESVSLSASGLPDGAKAVFQPTSIQSGSNAKLTVETTAATKAGTYTVTVTGAGSGGRTATTALTLTVTGDTPPDGEVKVTVNPSSVSVQQGFFAQFSVTATGGAGTLALSAAGNPAGTQLQFHPRSIAQGGSSNVFLSTGFQTPVGTHRITVTATSADGKTGTATFTLTVTSWGVRSMRAA
ncbi:trypsin-like serine protease [Saccharothrix algeriensis]|uniref:Trypsin-like serine protease n=1 Tax=Saccharothrix algeriensis TaxID=173560 RepID=A0A8T8HWG9_9PSEU|nr:trypsin-like serine protease [Saccharothrix algeriensis]MBM7814183.1 secreted trypsin-like serine protease/methionine-rich copper-binding protein CopC [Saccharothrix algeriensis]QTR02550.1 trypsin-like serine protease [Saccharothrix algeriensis]